LTVVVIPVVTATGVEYVLKVMGGVVPAIIHAAR
jgi:hypothetical protein